MSSEIDVQIIEETDDAWTARVDVRDARGSSQHRVRIPHDVHGRLAGAATSPEDLVRASFEFLLERERKESILRQSELPMISRYFPDFEDTIKRRLA